MDVNNVIKQWGSLTTSVEKVDFSVSGYDYSLCLAGAKVPDLAAVMLKEGFYLVDLMGVHVTPAIEVVYQFAHFETRCRVMAHAFVDDKNEIPTISDTFQGANWHERETRDFHGVVFTDHPNLEPLILAEEDVDLKPLLKDEKKLKEVAAIRRQQPKPEAAKPKAAKSTEQS
ncbi:MAG: NADH-quinone oxidoreductase subunit C [Thermodesulfobacteriota bacterium]|nr:NADH-quinone oxidoreductase subunit C [Thermodesulfobacteriota bacterium]